MTFKNTAKVLGTYHAHRGFLSSSIQAIEEFARMQVLRSASRALAVAIPILQSADLPVKQIVLYRHGIAYFERQGTVADGEEARLEFKNSDMNDILKSLVVTDASRRQARL